jgi:hypothetical protein
MKDKLNKLLALNHCGISIEINQHKNCYESVETYIDQKFQQDEHKDFPEALKECIEKDTFIYIQIYPETPVSFVSAFHYDLEKCIDLILEQL